MVARLALCVIAVAAMAASFVAITEAAIRADGHVVLVYALPFALEPLALAAAWEHTRSKERTELVVFWLAFIAAVVINVAAAHPNVPLMALHAIPPVAVICAGHIVVRDLARRGRARASLRVELEPAVRAELHDELRDDVHAELHEELAPKVHAELRREVRTTERTTHERITETSESAALALADAPPAVQETAQFVQQCIDGGRVEHLDDPELVQLVQKHFGVQRRAAYNRLKPLRDAAQSAQ